jgi:hypothetical protein
VSIAMLGPCKLKKYEMRFAAIDKALPVPEWLAIVDGSPN